MALQAVRERRSAARSGRGGPHHSSDGHRHGVVGGRHGSVLRGRPRGAGRELHPRAAQLIQARDHLVADRRVVGQIDALQAEDDLSMEAVQIPDDLPAALVIQASLQAR